MLNVFSPSLRLYSHIPDLTCQDPLEEMPGAATSVLRTTCRLRLPSDNLKKVLPTYDEVARFARATTRLRELLVLLPNKSIPVVDLVIKCKQVAL